MKLSQGIEGYRFASLAEGKSPKTMEGYDWAFKKNRQVFRRYGSEEIKTGDIRNLLFYLHTQSGLSSSSIQSVWRTIRSFYNWANRELLVKRPDKEIPMPKVDTREISPYSEDDIKALLRACDSTNFSNGIKKKQFCKKRPTAIRDKALILLLLDSGLRVSECARLQIKDINLETGEIVVRPYRTGHKSKARIVYLGTKARSSIWRYLSEREVSEMDYLFVTLQGYQMNKDDIRQLFVKIANRANVRNVHPHRFRHTFAIQFLRNGGNVFELQRLLGHSSLEMVKKYLSLAQIDIQNAHKRASPVDNWKLSN